MHTPIWAVVKCRLWGNCILNGRESEPVGSSFTIPKQKLLSE